MPKPLDHEGRQLYKNKRFEKPQAQVFNRTQLFKEQRQNSPLLCENLLPVINVRTEQSYTIISKKYDCGVGTAFEIYLNHVSDFW